MRSHPEESFPTGAGIWFGLGLGGFFDGIVLHQLLQWHHMLSSWYPATTLANLRLNTRWDGIFHSATYVFVVIGLYRLWVAGQARPIRRSASRLTGSILVGWAIFNLVEGLIDHELLGIHHVNEVVPRSEWVWWDIGFLVWGVVMLAAGWLLLRSGRGDGSASRPAVSSRTTRS